MSPFSGGGKRGPEKSQPGLGIHWTVKPRLLITTYQGIWSSPEMGYANFSSSTKPTREPQRARCGCTEGKCRVRVWQATHTPSPLGASSKVQSRCRSAGAERTRSGGGQRKGTGHPTRPPPPLPASLLPKSRGQGTESGPEECPEGGKELGGQFWGGLEMPLADLGPVRANLGSGLAQALPPWFPHTASP